MGSRSNLTKKDVQRSTVEASKYTTLEALKQIQLDHYMGSNGLDYDKESVDRLIREKQSKKTEENIKQFEKDQDEYASYLAEKAREL